MRPGEDVAAVVTTFRPGPSTRANLLRIAAQVGKVIVVDDSGDAGAHPAIDFPEIANLDLVRNETNLGIAAALNRGVERAARHGCKWVITLDDDTLVSTSYVRDVLRFAESGQVPGLGLVACSRGTDPRAAEEQRPARGAGGFVMKRTLITSGCLFEVRLFEEVGGFDEHLFIDLVDFDFCTRLRKSGRQVVLLETVGMVHKVGHAESNRFFGADVVIYNHAPFRLYYQIRNTFLFARKHFAFDPALCGYLLLDVFRLPVKALLFESQKRARLRYLAAGFVDGLKGRGGRMRSRRSGE